MSTAGSVSLWHSPNRSRNFHVSDVFSFDDRQDSYTKFAIDLWHHVGSHDPQEILRALPTDPEEVAEKLTNLRDLQITNSDLSVQSSIDLAFPPVPVVSILMYVARVHCSSQHVVVFEPRYLQL